MERFAISNTTVLGMIQPRRSSSPRLTARIHIFPDRGWTRDMSRNPEGQAREMRRSVLSSIFITDRWPRTEKK